MFQDFWKLSQELWEPESNDGYWEKVIRLTDEFYQKYRTPYAKGFALGLVNALDDVSKKGRVRMIPRKGMNPALEKMSQQRKENILISAAGKANMIISLMVLADKFDFLSEGLDKFINEYNKQLDAYNSGHVESVKDFAEVLKEEYGIEVKI